MSNPVKINFILPYKARRPAGGFRVMYEYANRLALKGYDVHLTYPIETAYMNYRLPYAARCLLAKIERFSTGKWFKFDPSITMSYVPHVEDKYVADADIVIATWWSTVLEMDKLGPSKGKKINLIQGFENWEGRVDLLYKSYDLPLVTNIVVASYLHDIVRQHTKKPIDIIHNAISKEDFGVDTPIEARNKYQVAMTYSTQEIKGSKYGLEALKLAKEQVPELQAELFGVGPTPSDLPNWVTYHRDPKNLREIYNRAAIFLSNSFTEGFPLTPAEALFCGCALICTDIDGHKEFALDNDTALLVEVRNVEQMAQKIVELVADDNKRTTLASRGNIYIKRFVWDNSVEKMERVIHKLLSCAD